MLDELGNEIEEVTPIEKNIDTKEVEKTFTQADMDKVVAKEKAKLKARYSDYDEIKGSFEGLKNENMTLKELSSVLSSANIGGTPAEQVDYLRSAYGLTKAQAVEVVKDDSEAEAYVMADRFAKRASDDDVMAEVERILEIAPNKRKTADTLKLEVLENRYGSIKFKGELAEAETWHKANGDGELKDLINSDDFKDFSEGSTLPLKDLVRKFIKYSGKAKEKPFNPGSVKDKGGSTEKEYYSSADVDKLTPSQLADPKINAKVRESMLKWK